MKKTFALFVLLFSFFSLAFGQAYQSLLPFYDDHNFGYKDLNGNVIIKPQFEKASLFSDNIGLLEAYSEFSDNSYSEKTYPIHYFDQPLAVVSINNKIGLINEKGEFIHEPCNCKFIIRYKTEPASLWLKKNEDDYQEDKEAGKCALIYKSGKGVSEFLDYYEDYEGYQPGVMYLDTTVSEWTDVLYYTDSSSRIIGINGEFISKENIEILGRGSNGFYLANANDSTYLFHNNTTISCLGKASEIHDAFYAHSGHFVFVNNDNKISIIDTTGNEIMEIEGTSFQGFNPRGHAVYYNNQKDSTFVIDINHNRLYSAKGNFEIRASIYGYTIENFEIPRKYFNYKFEEITEELYTSYYEILDQIDTEETKYFNINKGDIKVSFDGKLYQLIKGQDTVLCESFEWRYLSDINQEYLVVRDQSGIRFLNIDLKEKYKSEEYFQYQYLGNGNFTNYKNGFSIIENNKFQFDSTLISIKWKNKYVYAKKNTLTNHYTMYDYQLNQLATDVMHIGKEFGEWQTIVNYKELGDSLMFSVNGKKVKSVSLNTNVNGFQRQIYLLYTNDKTNDDVSFFVVKNKYGATIYKFIIGNAFVNPVLKEFKEFSLTFRKETNASIDSMYINNFKSYNKNVDLYLNNNHDKNVYVPPFNFYTIKNVIDQKYCLELNCMVYDCLDLASDKITKITEAEINQVNGPWIQTGNDGVYISNGIRYIGDISSKGTMAIPITIFAEKEDQTYTIIDSTGNHLITSVKNEITLNDSGNFYSISTDPKVELYRFPSEYIGQYEYLHFYGNFILMNDSLVYDENMKRIIKYEDSHWVENLGIWIKTKDEEYFLTKTSIRKIEKNEILDETDGNDFRMLSDEIVLDDKHDYKLAFLDKKMNLISRYRGRIKRIDYANKLIYFSNRGEGILNFDGKLLIPARFYELRFNDQLQLCYGTSSLTGITEYFRFK